MRTLWMMVACLGIGLIRPGAVEVCAQDSELIKTIIKELKDEDEEVRGTAAALIALGLFGPEAKAAVPALVEALKDKDRVREDAVRALAQIGPPAVTALVRALKDKDENLRQQAATVLGKIGAEAKAAVPALVEVLKDKDKNVRQQAAIALGKIGLGAKAAVPALVEALKDKDKNLRQQAAVALVQIGPPALGALIEILRDKDENVRLQAAVALGQIGLEAETAIPALVEALKDKDEHVRQQAAVALVQIGPPTVAALIEALKDKEESVRQQAAIALGRIGPDAKAAVPALVKAMKDKDRVVRQQAAKALAQIGLEGLEPKVAVTALVEGLKDKDRIVRQQAAKALGQIGPEAKAAVPALMRILSKDDDQVRLQAIESLGLMGSEAEIAILPLARMLIGPSADFRIQASRALGRIGPPAISALVETLKDVNGRQVAVVALGSIGPEAKGAIPALLQALKAKDDRDPSYPAFRLKVADALSPLAVGIQDKKQLSELEAELDNQMKVESDQEVRFALGKAIRNVQRVFPLLDEPKEPRPFIEAVRWTLNHPWLTVAVLYVPFFLALWLSILWLRPLWLLRINDELRPYTDLKLPDWFLGLKVPLRKALLAEYFNYHTRVLDAWVSRQIKVARVSFQRIRTVEERTVHIAIPVVLNGKTITEFAANDLQPQFADGAGRLLIVGEGGSGKTSLACQIGT